MLWVFVNRNVEEDSVARMRAVEEALAAKKKVLYQALLIFNFQCHFELA